MIHGLHDGIAVTIVAIRSILNSTISPTAKLFVRRSSKLVQLDLVDNRNGCVREVCVKAQLA